VRVLYSFPDGIGRPGIGTTAFHQVRELARHGVDVTLYCTSAHRELPPSVRIVETLTVGGHRIPHRALGIQRSYRYHDLRVALALRRRGAEFELVHSWPRATVHTSRAAHRRRIPCLREVPNTHTGHAYDVVARELAALGLGPRGAGSHAYDAEALALEEDEYALADALLVPSEYSLATFVERGVARGKLVLHRYGYEPERFFARTNGARPERPFTALFVGRCEPRKGLHHALRAWHDSGAAEHGRFFVVGAFEPGYRNVLARDLDHPSVEVCGFVADPSALMRESDVFILPSVEEGSALVTYEAQASGCVLVVSEAAGARCRHEVEGLVHKPGDVATLTEHLVRLQAEPGLLDRLRAASQAQAATLSWSAAGGELAEIYARYARSAYRREGVDSG
jgi:glycosyltransferase involved in cell wall biosynthesis